MRKEPVDRQLSASLDPADPSRILVQSGRHQQGYVLVNNLQGDLRNAISSGLNRPHSIAWSEEVNAIGQSIHVHGTSAVQSAFDNLTMSVAGWSFDPAGVTVTLYRDGSRLAEALITRDQPLSIESLKIVVGLLTLDLTDDTRRRAQFVLLKYL